MAMVMLLVLNIFGISSNLIIFIVNNVVKLLFPDGEVFCMLHAFSDQHSHILFNKLVL